MFVLNSAADLIGNYLGKWAIELSITSILFRIGISFLFAAIIGCERSNKLHSAGLRTFILVSVASTASMLLDSFIAESFQTRFPTISAATVVGIAIISSYSILYSSKNKIKGLTTAVALWECSITGILIGAGFYTAFLISFAAMLFCLSLLPYLETYLKDRSNHFEVHLELKDRRDLPNFIITIRKLGLKIDDIESNPAYLNTGLSVFSIAMTIQDYELKKYKTHTQLIEVLDTLEYVSYIEELK